MKELLSIQSQLKAPKGQRNNFGKYNYRSCEDILEALKPLLAKEGVTLFIFDELVLIGDRYYIKSTAQINNATESIRCFGYAREELDKKGMDASQITGACSSYARKYALNGLFLIDDTKDSDHTNEHGKGQTTSKAPETAKRTQAKPEASKAKVEPKAEKLKEEPEIHPDDLELKKKLDKMRPLDPTAGDTTKLDPVVVSTITEAFGEFELPLGKVEMFIDLASDQWTNNVKTVLLEYWNRIDAGDTELKDAIASMPVAL